MKIKLRSGTVSGIAVILRKKGVRGSIRDSRYIAKEGSGAMRENGLGQSLWRT